MADYNASVPPPPAHQTANAAKPVNASKTGNIGGGTGGGSSATKKLEKSLKMMNFGLLAWIGFAWLSWFIFLAGAQLAWLACGRLRVRRSSRARFQRRWRTALRHCRAARASDAQ